jgi:hypothetical protein
MALMPHQLANLANMVVERNIGKPGKMTDISLPDQNYIAKKILEMGHVTEKVGPECKFNVMHDFAETTKWSGMFDTDTVAINNDTQVKGTVRWSKLVTAMSWDKDEPEFQAPDIEIINVMDERRHQAMNSRWTFLDPSVYSQPVSDSQEKPPITGLPHWLPAAATEGAGFNGGDPPNFSNGAAGLPVATYTNWKSYNVGWKGTLGWENFVDPLLQALDFTQFESPDPFPSLTAGKTDKTKTLITTYAVKRGLRRLLRKSNENVSYVDMFNAEGSVIKGTALIWSKFLDRTAGSDNGTVAEGYNDLLYGINFNYLWVTYQKGKKENWSPAIRRAGSYSVFDKFLDSWIAFYTTDRRQLGFAMNRVA